MYVCIVLRVRAGDAYTRQVLAVNAGDGQFTYMYDCIRFALYMQIEHNLFQWHKRI